jgi:hypothetical protein
MMMAMDGPLGVPVRVAVEVNAVVSVEFGAVVLVGAEVLVRVAMAGVAVAPMTTGVGVWIRGVGVGGKKGVGPDPGWNTQPLQDESKNASRTIRIGIFIFFSWGMIVSRFWIRGTVSRGPLGLQELALLAQQL